MLFTIIAFKYFNLIFFYYVFANNSNGNFGDKNLSFLRLKSLAKMFESEVVNFKINKQ